MSKGIKSYSSLFVGYQHISGEWEIKEGKVSMANEKTAVLAND